MGFFSGLFEKKTCAICGGEIGLFGNRKLEDGNCCKNCAAKLSPWFSERRSSTVEEIKDQLAYREENKAAVAEFNVTREFGDHMRVLIDEDAGNFVVTRAKDLEADNPDVISLDDVTRCDIDIREDRNEIYRKIKDKEGNTKSVSYNPRRYKYSYNFYIKIGVKNPFFDEIEFSLSDRYIHVEAGRYGRSSYNSSDSLLEAGLDALLGTSSYVEGGVPSLADKRNDPEYAKYDEMARELKEALMRRTDRAHGRRDRDDRDRPEPQSMVQPKVVTCPCCGAVTTPDAKGCCEFCGSPLPRG